MRPATFGRMAVSSPATALGTPLPDVTLPDVDGRPVRLPDLRGDGILVIVWSANHCPYVRHVERRLGILADAFDGTGVSFAAVASNDVEAYPDDDVAGMREQVARAGWHFPYLVDSDQSVAHALGAVCTPDIFVFDSMGRLAYRGAFDTASPKNGNPVDGSLLRDALTALLAGRPAPQPQRPALGCGLKWRPVTGSED